MTVTLTPIAPVGGPAMPLKHLRLLRGWSQTNVLRRLEDIARDLDVRLPGRDSLKRMLSRWENGHAGVSQFYTVLLCRVFDLPAPYGPCADIRRARCHNSRLYGVRFPNRPGAVATS